LFLTKPTTDLPISATELCRGRDVKNSTFAEFSMSFDFRLLQQYRPKADLKASPLRCRPLEAKRTRLAGVTASSRNWLECRSARQGAALASFKSGSGRLARGGREKARLWAFRSSAADALDRFIHNAHRSNLPVRAPATLPPSPQNLTPSRQPDLMELSTGDAVQLPQNTHT
jgi:hypothetical protein